jgi:hypothetical protein
MNKITTIIRFSANDANVSKNCSLGAKNLNKKEHKKSTYSNLHKLAVTFSS